MSDFIDALAQNTNGATTENDAATNASSLDAVLDFFALAGAMRSRPADTHMLFAMAYNADPKLAVKVLFYLRDVRGGQGERAVFISCYRELFKFDYTLAVRLLPYIAEYGRWHDIMSVLDLAGKPAITLIAKQLREDFKALEKDDKASISLLAKWLPSVKTSSKQTRILAQQMANNLGLTPRQYRLKVAKLRKHIGLLEQKMSANQWDGIDFSKLPGQALRKHTKAFKRHVPEKYAEFTDKATKGEVKLNAAALYPYEVLMKLWDEHDAATADAMWANLPDYTNGVPGLVIADVSASMTWNNKARAMATSVSLAMYFAERNKGPFNGYFMTFSTTPSLVKVTGKTLSQRINAVKGADIGGSTNIQKAFEAVLAAAQKAKATQDELPKVLYIISDMEFDSCTQDADTTNFEYAKKLFADAGYELPHVVFWNVEARQNQTPATKFDSNVTLISGLSPSVFKHAVQGLSPVESMLEVLGNERYKALEKAFEGLRV